MSAVVRVATAEGGLRMANPRREENKYRVTVTLSDGTKGVHEVPLPDDIGVALSGMARSQLSVNDDLDHGRSIHY